jgi:hypothetical protein
LAGDTIRDVRAIASGLQVDKGIKRSVEELVDWAELRGGARSDGHVDVRGQEELSVHYQNLGSNVSLKLKQQTVRQHVTKHDKA